MLEPSRVRPHVHSLDIVGRWLVLARERERRVQRGMRAPAAGILLDRDAGPDDVERLSPGGQYLPGVVIAFAIEHVEKALFVLERTVIGGKSIACQQRGEQAVSRAVADMQRLYHGSEIRLDAGCERGGDRQSGRHLVLGQLEELRASRSAAEHAESGGRMP